MELETLEEAALPNPFSDPENQQTPLAAVTIEGNSSKHRSVLRGRKSTLEQDERTKHVTEERHIGRGEEEKVVYMVQQK